MNISGRHSIHIIEGMFELLLAAYHFSFTMLIIYHDQDQ